MPLFFFDIYNDVTTQDEDGIELADEEAALRRAHAEAQNLAAESIREHGHLILDHRIVVRGEDGATIGEVRFDEAVDIRQSEEMTERRNS
jgi:predicted N-acetyltransferase YhbS